MSRQVVRRLASEVTHIAEVTVTTGAIMFGAVYRRPPSDTRALCGVHIKDGVVMRDGTKVKCRPCRHIAEGDQ